METIEIYYSDALTFTSMKPNCSVQRVEKQKPVKVYQKFLTKLVCLDKLRKKDTFFLGLNKKLKITMKI
jgi:hypothetical protein